MSGPRTCAGPIFFADQGIQVCRTCGGCICCDHVDVDHSEAEYECLVADGPCRLKVHRGRPCWDRPNRAELP